MILVSLFCLTLIILYKIIIKPLVSIFKLKAQFKDAAIVSYFPIVGDIFRGFQISFEKYRDMLELFRQRHINNPNVKFILSNLFGEPLIEIIDPEYTRECFLKHENYKKFDFIGHNKLGRNSIVFQNGQRWKQARTIISSALMHDKLGKKTQMMNEVVAKFIGKGIGISIYKFLSTITGEIVCRTFFGNNGQLIDGKQAAPKIVKLINEIGNLQIQNPYYFCKIRLFGQKSWNILPTSQEQELEGRIDQIYEWATQIIKQKIFDYNPQNPSESVIDGFIGEYLRNDTINIDEMISQFLMLLFAGSDTTATMIAHCLYFLAQHPQDQEELLIEIEAITKKRNVVREQDLSKLINLQAFIYEVLRFRSPNFSPILRQVTKTHFVRDLKLEKGWYVFQPTQLPLLNEYYIPNAEQFDYKRWLKISPVKNDNGFVFIPFGAGPRVCVGQQLAMMETKIVLTHLLKKFKISLDSHVEIDWKIKFLYQMEPDTALIFELRE